jgi:hypothetical protein
MRKRAEVEGEIIAHTSKGEPCLVDAPAKAKLPAQIQ